MDVNIYDLYLKTVQNYLQLITITVQNCNINFSDGLQYNFYCYNDPLNKIYNFIRLLLIVRLIFPIPISSIVL